MILFSQAFFSLEIALYKQLKNFQLLDYYLVKDLQILLLIWLDFYQLC